MICRIKPLKADGSSIISIELRRYNGHHITLDDGSNIKTGDQIIEIHLNSTWFKRRCEERIEARQLPWITLHCFAGEEIPHLVAREYPFAYTASNEYSNNSN